MSSKVQTVQTDTWQMRYMRFGKEGARPLVILPGLSVPFVTDAADAIRQAYQALAADYDMYLFDRRSTMPEGETYTIRMMADETAQAMQMQSVLKRDIVLTLSSLPHLSQRSCVKNLSTILYSLVRLRFSGWRVIPAARLLIKRTIRE